MKFRFFFKTAGNVLIMCLRYVVMMCAVVCQVKVETT